MFEINKGISDTFKKNGITIPFPQRDVHIYNHESKDQKERGKAWVESSE